MRKVRGHVARGVGVVSHVAQVHRQVGGVVQRHAGFGQQLADVQKQAVGLPAHVGGVKNLPVAVNAGRA